VKKTKGETTMTHSIGRRGLLATAASLAAVPAFAPRAHAQGAKPIKLGVLTDMSGTYRDIGGQTSAICVQAAAQEFAAKGFTVEVISADHQNKPDVGAGIARQWFDRDGVDVILDVPTSSVALAVAGVAREKNKVFIDTGAGSTDLTGAQCSPNTLHWSYDTYMLAKSTGGATVKAGGASWYFITADYVFGQGLQRDATGFITAAGGQVKGASLYPFPGTSDFSSYMISAQASGAKVLGLANAGADTITCIKQAAEFGLTGQMQIAALLMFISDVHAIGLQAAQGLRLTESYYWDLNDGTRAFNDKIKAKSPNNWPNMSHAGCYAGTLHYLKAVADLGAAKAQADGAAVVAKMKATPCKDDAFGAYSIRADGRVLVPAYLFEAKKPAESKGPWDLYKLIATTPADQAYRPVSEGGCAFIKA
jgi:branched-chain amino acid transport system substrate-binding protein